jgi:membrane protein YdbS with pleckstrin-like domain
MAPAEERNETEQLAEDVIGMVQTYYKLTLVTATKKSTSVAATVVVVLIIAVTLLLMIAFGGLALGYWLGNLLSNIALGYLLTALFFLLISLVLYLSRKKLFAYVRNIIVRKIYE